MRSSPRRPLILKRRKLALSAHSSSGKNDNGGQDEPDGDPRKQKFPDGIKIVNHPTMPNTQVVVIPKSADIQSIITALTTKGKECGSNGPNKFILVSSGGSSDSFLKISENTTRKNDCKSSNAKFHKAVIQYSQLVSLNLVKVHPSNTDTEGSPLDDSLTNIQWLGKMSSDGLGPCSVKQEEEKENAAEPQGGDVISFPPGPQLLKKPKGEERPPYSYMAMIQFAINSTHNQRMTLKEIYTWIETHFPYFKHTAKPGWKNSIRHNLSLHDMFVRETSNNGKISFWTIRPESNRCLTLDQVVKQQKHPVPDPPRLITGSNGAKEDEKPPQKGPRRPETPIIKKRRERSERSSSRRKQKHVLPPTEEPVLLFPDGSHLDSGLVSDCSSFQESQVQEHGVDFNCIEAESTFKTPIKEKSREMPASSTPSKNLVGSCVLGGHEPWKVTPLKKEGTVFDVSPVRTPCGVTLTPMCESTDFLSFNSTPFREAPLFDSPRELLNTEGLVLDTMNDSLSKILLDISFTGLEDEDFGVENISWSQFIPELK
uniref:Forkhead box protein M1 n=1 Tax=Latimeria chalumnae TaxID=7897 RepID=H3AHA5_LATCH